MPEKGPGGAGKDDFEENEQEGKSYRQIFLDSLKSRTEPSANFAEKLASDT